MLRFKDLMERINETRYLSEGPTHLEYGGSVGEKEYTIKVPQHKELGDYSDKGLHRKISKENPHLHHHEVTAIVNSGGEEESHEKVEHEGKTHTHHVINYQEPRHLYEEVEKLDEDLYKDQHPGYNEKHAAHSTAKKLHSSGHLKPEYHKDGSATIHVKPYDDTSSTRLTDRIHQDAGLYYNHPRRKFAKGITQAHNGLKYRTRSDDGGKTHSVHISPTTVKNMRDGSAREVREEVEGIHEISAMKAIRTSVKREVSGVTKSIQTGDFDAANQKKIDNNKDRIHKKYGYRAANIAHNVAGRRLDYHDGPYQPRVRKEEFDFDLFESIMLGEGDLSIRTLYNKYADHALGAGDSPDPKKAAAVKKAIVKVHGATVMGHLEKAKNAAAKNDQDSESNHFNNARNSAKTDTMSATVGKNRSSMRKEEVDLDESRMKDLAMDMESLSHADFKKKHRRSKQEMQDALKSEELKGNQHKIDANKNGKVDGHDFKILRNAKKARYQ
jgi:hypothetical protein